jgi:hypothetical protein
VLAGLLDAVPFCSVDVCIELGQIGAAIRLPSCESQIHFSMSCARPRAHAAALREPSCGETLDFHVSSEPGWAAFFYRPDQARTRKVYLHSIRVHLKKLWFFWRHVVLPLFETASGIAIVSAHVAAVAGVIYMSVGHCSTPTAVLLAVTTLLNGCWSFLSDFYFWKSWKLYLKKPINSRTQPICAVWIVSRENLCVPGTSFSFFHYPVD